MKTKRILATLLWFYSGLLVGSLAAIVLGLPSVFALLFAVPAATFVALDPIGLFWTGRAIAERSSTVMDAQGQ